MNRLAGFATMVLGVACTAAGPALAQSERERALEARVAELERLVQTLLDAQPDRACPRAL